MASHIVDGLACCLLRGTDRTSRGSQHTISDLPQASFSSMGVLDYGGTGWHSCRAVALQGGRLRMAILSPAGYPFGGTCFRLWTGICRDRDYLALSAKMKLSRPAAVSNLGLNSLKSLLITSRNLIGIIELGVAGSDSTPAGGFRPDR